MDPVRVSAVSYLNTLPFQYGLKNAKNLSFMEVSLDIPSVCADKLLSGEASVGLIPVAVLPDLPEHSIVTDYCIAADGPVRTVLLYSDVPFSEIETIYLDYQSRTSVNLCRILCKEHWNIDPVFKSTEKGFEGSFSGASAGVIIGDRTFHMDRSYPYVYDLAQEWKEMTGLPFVFAAWVAHATVPYAFVRAFNDMLRFGMDHLEEALQEYLSAHRDPGNLKGYLTESIKYVWDTKKQKGLQLFLQKRSSLPSL